MTEQAVRLPFAPGGFVEDFHVAACEAADAILPLPDAIS